MIPWRWTPNVLYLFWKLVIRVGLCWLFCPGTRRIKITKWIILVCSLWTIKWTTNCRNHFLMAHTNDHLTVNPCYCVFVLKIGDKGWVILIVLPWRWANKSSYRLKIGYQYLKRLKKILPSHGARLYTWCKFHDKCYYDITCLRTWLWFNTVIDS